MKNSRTVLLKAVIASVFSLIIICILIYTEWHIKKMLTTVVICGQEYQLNVSEIDLSGKDISEQDFPEKMLKLSQLKFANLTGTGLSPELYDRLHAAVPECQIKWNVPLGADSYPNDSESLILNGSVSPSDLASLRYFTRLNALDAGSYPLCDELFDATADLRDPESGCMCIFSGTLYGKAINGESKQFDFSSEKITDLSEFYRVLRFFPQVSSIYLGDIEAPDEEVMKLNRAFPDTKVVWLVEFAYWQVRSDIQVFSTLIGAGHKKPLTEKEAYPLLAYCTDLRAVDLGHNLMSDISVIAGLENLEVLILSGNRMKSIEALGNLKKLRYLEMFNCENVEDLSPLAGCTELEDLMLNNMETVRNANALESCKKLSLLYARNTSPVGYEWKELKKALPNCTVDTKTYHIRGVWRNSKKNDCIRRAFNHWKKVKAYNSWDDYVIGKTEVGWINPKKH